MKEVTMIKPNKSEKMHRVLFLGFDFDCSSSISKDAKKRKLVSLYFTKEEIKRIFNNDVWGQQ